MSVIVNDLVAAVQQFLCRSPDGTNIAGRFVKFRLDVIGATPPPRLSPDVPR